MPLFELEIFGGTHVGRQRTLNEDTLAYNLSVDLSHWATPDNMPDKPIRLERAGIILADGMGGAEAGEVASALASEAMRTFFNQSLRNPALEDDEVILHLRQGMMLAHDRIVMDALANNAHRGMGTTLIAGLIERDHLMVMWSGDSRVYRYHPEQIDQDGKPHPPHLQMISDDHSMVWEMVMRGEITAEEARVHPYSNVITQSLGDVRNKPKPDYRVVPIYEGDLILFCSDGLNGMLSDPDMARILASGQPLDLMVGELIDAANEAGGHDNISLVLAKVLQGKATPRFTSTEKSEPGATEGGSALLEKMTQAQDLPSQSNIQANPPVSQSQTHEPNFSQSLPSNRAPSFPWAFIWVPLLLAGIIYLGWHLYANKGTNGHDRYMTVKEFANRNGAESEVLIKLDSLYSQFQQGSMEQDQFLTELDDIDTRLRTLPTEGAVGSPEQIMPDLPEEPTSPNTKKEELYWIQHYKKLLTHVNAYLKKERAKDPNNKSYPKQKAIDSLSIAIQEALGQVEEGKLKKDPAEIKINEFRRKFSEIKAMPDTPSQAVEAPTVEADSADLKLKEVKDTLIIEQE
jgi:protein phosphatase